MEVKTGKSLYPQSPLNLYLKLYCGRRDTKYKLMEGIRSWLSLSKSEKQKFHVKFQECKIKYKHKLANILTKAQPFMKRKKLKRSIVEENKSKEEADHHPAEPLESRRCSRNDDNIVIENIDHQLSIGDNNNIDNNNASDVDNDAGDVEMGNVNDNFEEETSCQNIGNSLSLDESVPILNEPTAPCIKTPRQLFEMLSAGNEQNTATWSSLTSTQKSRYQRATKLLKTDYITKYRAYLESLPSKKLFEYYNNFVFN